MALRSYTTLHTTIPKTLKEYLAKQAEKENKNINTILIESIELYKTNKRKKTQTDCIESTFIDLLRPEIRKIIQEELAKKTIFKIK